MSDNTFLKDTPENGDFNQYWYSTKTIKAMVDELQSCGAKRIAFLSTPSLYFSLTDEELKKNSMIFDYDEMWASHPNFIKYDFNAATDIPAHLYNTFDMVVVDPPFITHDVWEKYAVAMYMLLNKADNSEDKFKGKVLLTSIAENAALFDQLFKATKVEFRPSIPNLIYQYDMYTNYPTTCLNELNSEVDW